MLRVNQIKIKPGQGEREILRKTARLLKLDEKDIQHMEILRCSIDARKKPEIWCSYTVDVELKKPSLEAGICRCLGQALVTRTVRQTYHFPDCGEKPLTHPPVIVGMGPAGLFCACYLARHGYKPIVLERGQDVDRRRADVQRFWDEGILQPQSNVQFGEGGAGTFSDGKLNTLVKDKYGRNREVLRTFVAHGAPERILYDARPHMGTDVLSQVVKNMRQEILDRGGQVLFGTMLEGLETEEDGSRITAVFVSGGRRIPCEQLVLAIGHSARDTFQMLHEAGLPMEARPFAVGLRVEHPQSMINRAQYGAEHPGPGSCQLFKSCRRVGFRDFTGVGPGSRLLQTDSQGIRWQRSVLFLHVSRRLCGQCFLRARPACRKRYELQPPGRKQCQQRDHCVRNAEGL